MSKKKVSFTTSYGQQISFISSGKKKRKNPRRKLNPWQKYVQDNMSRVIDEYNVEATEAMRILADEFHYGE